MARESVNTRQLVGDLSEVLARHLRFLRGAAGGERANVSHADLSQHLLVGLNLEALIAAGTNFSRSDLSKSSLRFADLFCANLEYANCTVHV